MVSSRYHGIVTCMPSLVASAGVTMDERIRNLMRERGHEHLLVTVDDAELEPKLLQIMESLVREAESVRDGIGRTVVRNLKVMARMARSWKTPSAAPIPNFPCAPAFFPGKTISLRSAKHCSASLNDMTLSPWRSIPPPVLPRDDSCGAQAPPRNRRTLRS